MLLLLQCSSNVLELKIEILNTAGMCEDLHMSRLRFALIHLEDVMHEALPNRRVHTACIVHSDARTAEAWSY